MPKSHFDNQHQSVSTGSKIVTALERISEAFRVLLWQESKEHKLSPIQAQLLVFVLHHKSEKCKVSYLAKEFNMTKPTISDAVKVLLGKRLVAKNINPSDTRSYTISLTEPGMDIANKISYFTSAFQSPLDNMAVYEKEHLLVSLLNIIQHLNDMGIITVQRMCNSCSYHSLDKNNEHYCGLLQKRLKSHELRIDCPEHMSKAI